MHVRYDGYTLLELLLTVAVAAVVLTLGVPAFGELIASSRQRAEINALFHAIHLARKESIVRRRVVTLCPSADGRQCLSTRDWSAGWIMFVNADRDHPARVDDGEALLQRHTVYPSVYLKANRHAFSLRSTHLRATNGTFVACDRGGRAAARALVVSWTGRPRATLEDTRGRAYDCAD